MRTPVSVATVVATLALIASATGCSSPAGDRPLVGMTPSTAVATTSARNWTCPPTVDDPAWPEATRTAPGVLAPDTPDIVVECSYRLAASDGRSELFGPSVRYTGAPMRELLTTFATATSPDPGMSCPSMAGRPRYVTKYTLFYADGGSALVTLSGSCPPVLSNTTLTLQPTQPPSSASTP
ncbi:hypothetical protein ACXVUM_09260 [Williamsia sp. SKLECPSW1]